MARKATTKAAPKADKYGRYKVSFNDLMDDSVFEAIREEVIAKDPEGFEKSVEALRQARLAGRIRY